MSHKFDSNSTLIDIINKIIKLTNHGGYNTSVDVIAAKNGLKYLKNNNLKSFKFLVGFYQIYVAYIRNF